MQTLFKRFKTSQVFQKMSRLLDQKACHTADRPHLWHLSDLFLTAKDKVYAFTKTNTRDYSQNTHRFAQQTVRAYSRQGVHCCIKSYTLLSTFVFLLIHPCWCSAGTRWTLPTPAISQQVHWPVIIQIYVNREVGCFIPELFALTSPWANRHF